MIDRVIAAVHPQATAHGQCDVLIVGKDESGLVREDDVVRFVDTGLPVGAARARNTGAGLAKGDYLCFLDSDCIPQPGWLMALLCKLRELPCCVSGAVQLGGGNFWVQCLNLAGFHEHLSTMPCGDRSQLASFSLAMRRETFAVSGGFDEGLQRVEDLDYTIRLHRQGVRLCFEPAALVEHRHSRRTLRDFLRHAFVSGEYSIIVRQRYPEAFHMPWPLRRRYGILLLSPAVALWISAGIFARDASVRRLWYAFPFVVLSKIAWCLGAWHSGGRAQSVLAARETGK